MEEEDLFGDIKENKVNISLTIGADLLKQLEDYKKEKQITSLSPMIDKMLRDWMKRRKHGS